MSEVTDKPAATAPATVEEPQNELTKKFTDAEWTALKEFRSKLPDTLSESFKEKAEAKKFTLWGVEVDTEGAPSAKASVVFMKFLRARALNVPEATKMLIDTLRWREEFNVEAAAKESFPPEIFGNLGHIFGKDKLGNPVTYNLYGANKDLKAVFGDVDRFIRWRVALMEKGVAELDFETVDQMLQVHDYEGVGLSSRDANSKKAASEATNIFQTYYPEFLYKKFFVNVPTIMSWIFWLFKPLMSAQTLAKMSVIGSGPQAIGKELLQFVDASQLPKRYGGQTDAWEESNKKD